MNWFYAYLAVGLPVLALVTVLYRYLKRIEDPFYLEILQRFEQLTSKPASPNRWARIWDQVGSAVFLFALGLFFWPFAAFLLAQLTIDQAPDWEPNPNAYTSEPEPVFAVESAHLLEQVSIAEIEQREMVFDPLGAAPHVPFGHLNAVWQAFIAKATPEDQVWGFSAHWKPKVGPLQRRSGYVLVRDQVPSTFLMTECRFVRA